jgi:hypothetical protein
MKHYYYAISRSWNDENGKTVRIADAISIAECYNLYPIVNGISHIVCVHQAGTKKHAIEIANDWNEAYLSNGEYALSDTRIYPVTTPTQYN